MPKTLQARLTSTLYQSEAANVSFQPLLQTSGPRVVIGAAAAAQNLIAPVSPTPQTLFGPRAGAVSAEDDVLWIADTGHHRLLGWRRRPEWDNAPADLVIGQPDFFHEGRNAQGDVTAASMNVPSGVAICGKALAVADAWNHRVLLWLEAPRESGVPADLVLGQENFAVALDNQGKAAPSANTLFWPYGVHWDGGRLWVADTGNRRLLMWDGLPSKNGQPADLVLGQPDFSFRDENSGGAPSASSMRWPHAIGVWDGRLCLADAGNNRIMVWNSIPTKNNTPCDHILGQSEFDLVDHNQSLYWPNSKSLNMPYGLAVAGRRLLIADTANSRLLGWLPEGPEEEDKTGRAAAFLTGQKDFHSKGDNRWQTATRDSLCWPYGLAVSGETALVCDSGNNRVMLWDLAEETAAKETA